MPCLVYTCVLIEFVNFDDRVRDMSMIEFVVLR